MKYKILYTVFFLISISILLDSCTTFKAVKGAKSVNGTFTAFLKDKKVDGFFSISKQNSRIDVINSFGMSVYGIYINDKNAYIKDYSSGKIYKNFNKEKNDLSLYMQELILLTKKFDILCSEKHKNIIVLLCKKIDNRKFPKDLIIISKEGRVRINLKNIRVVTLPQGVK